MKKIVTLLLLVTVMAVSLFGCNPTPQHFTGEWRFQELVQVELSTELSQGEIDTLKEIYSAETEEEIATKAKDKFILEDTFANFYLKFASKNVYTYDPLMDREATWVLYQLTENTGFISFYTELDASAGNPYPSICPSLSYDAQIDTMTIVMDHGSFMVTLTLVR